MKIGFRNFVHVALISLIAALPAAPGNVRAAESQGEKGLKVTILVYSGRPDPTFFLEDEVAFGRVKFLLGQAKRIESRKDTVIPSILGYKGVMVRNVSGVEGIPESVAVYKGVIEVHDGGTTFLGDERNEFETFLLKQGIERKAIDPGLLKAAGVEIGTWPTPEKGN